MGRTACRSFGLVLQEWREKLTGSAPLAWRERLAGCSYLHQGNLSISGKGSSVDKPSFLSTVFTIAGHTVGYGRFF